MKLHGQNNTIHTQKIELYIRIYNIACNGMPSSCAVLSDSVMSDSLRPHGLSPPGSSVHGDSPGNKTGVVCSALLQGILPTQGSNPGLQHCRWIIYHLSHQGSPRILEWIAYSFFRGSSWTRNRNGVSCIAGGFFISWAARKACLHPTCTQLGIWCTVLYINPE